MRCAGDVDAVDRPDDGQPDQADQVDDEMAQRDEGDDGGQEGKDRELETDRDAGVFESKLQGGEADAREIIQQTGSRKHGAASTLLRRVLKDRLKRHEKDRSARAGDDQHEHLPE